MPGWVQVYAAELPGCSASGPSVSDAITVLRERISEHLAEARNRPPVPGTRKLALEL